MIPEACGCLVSVVGKLPRQVIERSLAAFKRLAAVGERVA